MEQVRGGDPNTAKSSEGQASTLQVGPLNMNKMIYAKHSTTSTELSVREQPVAVAPNEEEPEIALWIIFFFRANLSLWGTFTRV